MIDVSDSETGKLDGKSLVGAGHGKFWTCCISDLGD